MFSDWSDPKSKDALERMFLLGCDSYKLSCRRVRGNISNERLMLLLLEKTCSEGIDHQRLLMVCSGELAPLLVFATGARQADRVTKDCLENFWVDEYIVLKVVGKESSDDYSVYENPNSYMPILQPILQRSFDLIGQVAVRGHWSGDWKIL